MMRGFKCGAPIDRGSPALLPGQVFATATVTQTEALYTQGSGWTVLEGIGVWCQLVPVSESEGCFVQGVVVV